MSSIEEKLQKLREERIAREKARIEKLRELNIKKYNKNEPQVIQKRPPANVNQMQKSNSVSAFKTESQTSNDHGNNIKRPLSGPISKIQATRRVSAFPTSSNVNGIKDIPTTSRFSIAPRKKINNIPKVTQVKTDNKIDSVDSKIAKFDIKNAKVDPKNGKVDCKNTKVDPKNAKVDPKNGKVDCKNAKVDPKTVKVDTKTDINKRVLKEMKITKDANSSLSKFAIKNSFRKSFAGPLTKIAEKPAQARKSMIPKMESKESVFDRLYKPKTVARKTMNDAEKIQKDSSYLNKVLKSSDLITNNLLKTRRSISAVHFKRINKNEINNCIHKWSSVNENLDKIHLDEYESLHSETVTSAVKSERKKVKFMTPICANTPRPDELHARLKSWLQKRGKSLDSYHHLQCFGLHHFAKQDAVYDEENKENVALDSDSDDGSYHEVMNEEKTPKNRREFNEWRRVSSVNDSTDFNESGLNETLTTESSAADDLVIGALNDLAELLREGLDWKQSARWLRAIRERYPQVTSTASYWECRAALEERRGDLPASVHCWEEAIAKGIGHSVVEANLDQLLDKFMQLKISPNSGNERRPDPKLVDVKNVFKSTIIRFAVQQAKLRQSQTPIVMVTPVRRSGRLSHIATTTKLCQNMKEISTIAPKHQFTPNRNLVQTP